MIPPNEQNKPARDYTHFTEWNGTVFTNSTKWDNINYETKWIDMRVKEGWGYVVWNFWNNKTIDDFRV